MEELESLEDRARAMAVSIGKAVSGVLILKDDADAFRQETYIRDLNLEFINITELAESVKSAQVATATLYKDWQEKLAEETALGRRRTKLRIPFDYEALVKYQKQGKPRNSDY